MASFFTSGGAIPAAVRWIESAMLGSVATAIATIAVASIGYLAFTGRIDFRRSAQVIFGCFILFGAPVIAAGLQGIASAFYGGSEPPASTGLAGSMQQRPIQKPVQVFRSSYDPYAGAAIASD